MNKILKIQCELDWNNFSKNNIYKVIRFNRKPIKKTNTVRIKQLVQEIQLESKVQRITWKPRCKTWVLIRANKDSNRGDAINLLDALADAIKKGIEVDDAYFAAVIDYAVLKTKQKKAKTIDIHIIQDGDSIEDTTNITSYICDFLKG